MFDKRESAVSPVVAVILLLGIVGIIVGMAATVVFSNVDNILINEKKTVDVSIKISDDKMTIIPVGGKDLGKLESYSILTDIGELQYEGKTDIPYNNNPLTVPFDEKIGLINIVGHFSDGTSEIIFSGRIQPGSVVVPVNPDVNVDTTVKVTFNSNGGSAVSSQTITKGKMATEPISPTKEGFTFGGWYSDSGLSNEYGFNTPVTADITLHAKWNTNAKKVTVTFIAGEDATVSPSSKELIVGSPYGDLPTPTTSRKYYSFGGWYTESDGAGTHITSSITVSNTENHNLYAKWAVSDAYPSGSSGENGFSTLQDLVNDMNEWYKLKSGTNNKLIDVQMGYIYDSYRKYMGLYIRDDFSIGSNPIILTTGMINTDEMKRNGITAFGFNNGGNNDGKVDLKISRDKGYDGPLFIIENDITLEAYGTTVTFDGLNNEVSSPLIVVENGGKINSGKINLLNNKNTIENGDYGGKGGAIYNCGEVIMSWGSEKISENSAKYGGGIYNAENGVVTFNGGSIDNNEATKDGGGVYNEGRFTQNGQGSITKNTAEGNGGGVYNKNRATYELKNGQVSGNTATKGNGGGVYNEGTFTQDGGSLIIQNTAEGGGGVYNKNGATYELKNGQISGNTATKGNGGGVYNEGIFTQGFGYNNGWGSITKNTATTNGGGVYNYNGATYELKNGDISGNTATNGDSVYNGDKASFTLTRGVIYGKYYGEAGSILNGEKSDSINIIDDYSKWS